MLNFSSSNSRILNSLGLKSDPKDIDDKNINILKDKFLLNKK